MNLTFKQLTETFPDSEDVILEQPTHYKNRKVLLEVKKRLQQNVAKTQCKNDFERWLGDYCIEQNLGPEMKVVNYHIVRLKGYLGALHPDLIDPNLVTQEQIEYAKSQPIENLLDQPIRKVGTRYYSLCPLHNEKSPSFVIYKDTNTAWCFGCQQGGDSIKLVQLLNDLSFKAAVKYLNNY
jgi:hypothetical protein